MPTSSAHIPEGLMERISDVDTRIRRAGGEFDDVLDNGEHDPDPTHFDGPIP